MIVTCTMNPAIDLYVKTKTYYPDRVNRTIKDQIQPNGKGVNVSFILKMLGINNRAIGFSAGFTGRFILDALREKSILTDFVTVEGATRINVFTQVAETQEEYKLVNQGPEINLQEVEELLIKIKKLAKGDLLCLSGSNPQGVTDQTIIEVARFCREKEIKFVLDTSSAVILDILGEEPYCLKPNEEELALIFKHDQLSDSQIIDYGRELVKRGAEHVLVSLGGRGAYLFRQGESLYANAPQGELVNSAGAGDALLGTFIGLLAQEVAVAEAFSYAVAAGSSTAFREGLTDFDDVEELVKQITVKKIREEE